jgi:hypothetical protein
LTSIHIFYYSRKEVILLYRPTVRYDDIFKKYVDSLFQATLLDRNQLIRGALFAAAHSNEFEVLLKPYQKGDVPLPSPLWKADQHRFWLEQCPTIIGEGGDVNASDERKREANKAHAAIGGRGSITTEISRIGPAEGRTREIPSPRIHIKNQGGITFTIN